MHSGEAAWGFLSLALQGLLKRSSCDFSQAQTFGEFSKTKLMPMGKQPEFICCRFHNKRDMEQNWEAAQPSGQHGERTGSCWAASPSRGPTSLSDLHPTVSKARCRRKCSLPAAREDILKCKGRCRGETEGRRVWQMGNQYSTSRSRFISPFCAQPSP